MAPKQSKTTPIVAQSLLDECETEVRAQLAVIRERREGGGIGFDKDMAMAAAALGRVLVSSEGERRQHAKAQAREIASIPIDQIIAHLRTFSDDRRADIAREITGADDGEGLL